MNLGVIYNGKTVRKKKIQNLSRNKEEERSYVRKPKNKITPKIDNELLLF